MISYCALATISLITQGLARGALGERVPPSSPPLAGYQLVWSDEFDARQGADASAPDPSKWKPWAIGKRRDAMNVADAAQLDGLGHLVITTARVQSLQPDQPHYTSGGVWTPGIFEPTCGYFEARIKFQAQLGHWGAFWLNCAPMGEPVGDTAKGGVEMDIIEFHHRLKNKQTGQYLAQQTLHWDGYGKDHRSVGHTPTLTFAPDDDFHTYGLLWTSEQYVYYIDGIETWRVKKGAAEAGGVKGAFSPSQRPEYLILSLEVGEWGGTDEQREAATFPDSMIVDWVRVWQAKEPQ